MSGAAPPRVGTIAAVLLALAAAARLCAIDPGRDFSGRWILSRDRNVLTITRQVVDAAATTGSTLLYQREGFSAPAPQPATPAQ